MVQERPLFEVPSDTPLRGNYSGMAPDFTVAQDWPRYSDAEHARWRFLYARQAKLLPRYAAPVFRDALTRLDAADGIPDLQQVSAQLNAATGWDLVGVPGLIPNAVFFAHLAAGRFPVTVWIRGPHELDYLVEPDIFHDFFGHVPMLFDPVFAAYMRAYGRGGIAAEKRCTTDKLSRLYWYMVEFGLMLTEEGLRAYGSGILSSAAETQYCLTDSRPHRIRFDLERVLRTRYRIDDFQETYFVIESLDDLMTATEQPFAPIYDRLETLPDIAATEIMPGDVLVPAEPD